MSNQKITPHIWFDTNAKEAMEVYTSAFPESSIDHIEYYPDESIDPHFKGMTGKVFYGEFTLWGRRFACIDGGPAFTPNPSISFFVIFDTPAEVEGAWDKLIDGGSVLMALNTYPWAEKYGWLQDKYGVTWQLTCSKFHEEGSRITPLLMFTRDHAGMAHAAMIEYVSLFSDSGIDSSVHYEAGEGDKPPSTSNAPVSTWPGGHSWPWTAGQNMTSRSTRPSRLLFGATIKRKLTAYGVRCPGFPKPSSAAGAKTSSASAGKSCQSVYTSSFRLRKQFTR